MRFHLGSHEGFVSKMIVIRHPWLLYCNKVIHNFFLVKDIKLKASSVAWLKQSFQFPLLTVIGSALTLSDDRFNGERNSREAE
jgi:hypothetical protein